MFQENIRYVLSYLRDLICVIAYVITILDVEQYWKESAVFVYMIQPFCPSRD